MYISFQVIFHVFMNFFWSSNGSLDVYISDYLTLYYMVYKETDCNLKLVDEFLTGGYSFIFSQNLMSPNEKVNETVEIDFHRTNRFKY